MDKLNIVKWQVVSSYAMHPYFWSHTGATIYLGQGLVASMSNKQKLNPRSSTEAELIGEDNVLPEFLWLRYFIEAQGFYFEKALIYQDNLRYILLDNNIKLSSGNRMKHIHVRYFMIKDRIVMGYLMVKYLPTG